MRKITQGDIFAYLNKKGPAYHTLDELAEALNQVFHISADKTSISRIKNRKKRGYSNLTPGKIDAFYRELFPEKRSNDAMWAILEDAKDFVETNHLTFIDSRALEKDTFETYVKRMFHHGLPNVGCSPDISASQEQGADPMYPLVSDRLTFYRSDFFTGRNEHLNEIQNRLARDKIVVLTGMGGIGKSALATQFAFCNMSCYSSIQIVSGEFLDNFRSVILALRFDGLKDEKDPPGERYQKRMEILQKLDEHTLLIIDNVDSDWDNVKTFFDNQREMKFHLIITSRRNDMFRKQFCLPISPLPDEEQRKLFLHYSGMAQDERPDSPILGELLHYIEGHTLLIELVAKTMYNESGSLEEMLEWLRDQKTDHEFMEDGERKNPKEVIQKMLFRGKLDDEQRRLLYRLAFLPTEGISRRLFLRSLCPNDNVPLSPLEGQSLVIRERDRIRIHPVVRDAVRGIMPLEWGAHSEFLRLIQKTMEQPSNSLGEENMTSLCLLVRSILEVLYNSKVPPDLWNCLFAIVGHCKAVCQYETARCLCELLSSIDEDMEDVDKRIEFHLEFGGLHQRLADYNKAIDHYQKALEMTQRDDDQRGSCYNSLAVIYRKNAEYEEAMEYFEKALICYKREDLIATAQNDLGVVYINLGSNDPDPEKSREFYQKAKSCYEKSLKLREKLGASVRELAFSHHNIGSALHQLGKYDNALEEHKEALRLRKENHLQKPDIAASLNWIGNDLIRLERLPDAIEVLEESLAIRKTVLGERHPDLAWALISLSECYERMGDFSLAISSMQKAYDIREEALRPGHPYTNKARQRLSELKKKNGEPRPAT